MSRPLGESRPTGLTRAFLKAPTWLYRLHLGWVLGGRFVLLEHRGRRTGQTHQTVVEVVDHDDAFTEVIVCSGWGERSDWYRNLFANPDVEFETHRVRRRGTAEKLGPEPAQTALRHYGERHGRAFRTLAKRMLGTEPEGDVDAIAAALATAVPVLALRATETTTR